MSNKELTLDEVRGYFKTEPCRSCDRQEFLCPIRTECGRVIIEGCRGYWLECRGAKA